MKIKRVLLDQIKNHLEKKYELDMFSRDIRLSFVVYYIKTAKLPLYVKTTDLIRGAYEMFEEKTALTTFTRNVYGSIQKINANNANVVKFLIELANEI